MPPTIGNDCHIMLSHPDVNSGQPYGFLLETQDKDNGQAFAMQREITGDTQSVRIFFHVLLGDNLIDPNGQPHAETRAEMYAMLSQYLAKAEELTIATNMGAFANIGATGHTATEQHYPAISIIAVQLNNIGQFFEPVDVYQYQNSLWDGPLTWASSFWR